MLNFAKSNSHVDYHAIFLQTILTDLRFVKVQFIMGLDNFISFDWNIDDSGSWWTIELWHAVGHSIWPVGWDMMNKLTVWLCEFQHLLILGVMTLTQKCGPQFFTNNENLVFWGVGQRCRNFYDFSRFSIFPKPQIRLYASCDDAMHTTISV